MKSMKKSMFITTLLMVVLLVVAISTSTFAWFAANDTVVATQTTMTAATSSDANITIGWDLDNMGQSITFGNGSDMKPMIPELMPLLTAGDIPEQYVATNKDYAGINFSITKEVDDFTYEYANAPYVKVVDVDLDGTVAQADVSEESEELDFYDQIVNKGDIGLLKRIYRTQVKDVMHFVQTTATLTEGTLSITYGADSFDCLDLTANPVEDNQLTADDFAAMLAVGGEYSGVELRNSAGEPTSPQNGRRIYLIPEVDDEYTITNIGEAPDVFIPDGVKINEFERDYWVIVETQGKFPLVVEAEFYINMADVDEVFGLKDAQPGDKIYQVREKAENVTRTVYTDFVEDSFYTATIDNLNRFRTDIQTISPVTLSNEDGDHTSFYIKNNNAIGSPAAKITMKVRIIEAPSNLRSYLRLAVFYSTSGGTLNYAGTISEAEEALTHYGTIISGATSQDFISYEANGDTLGEFVQIDPQGSARIAVVAWYDGLGLDSGLSGESVSFTIEFSAENVQ